MPLVCCWPTAHFQHRRRDGEVFLSPILTVDESWMNSYDPEMKRQSAEWHSPLSPQRKLQKITKVLRKRCISCWNPWWTSVAPCSSTLNSMTHTTLQYCSIMCDMLSVQNSNSCCNVASSSFRTKWHLITIVTSRICRRSGWDILAHPPYSLDLAVWDFFLLPMSRGHLSTDMNMQTSSIPPSWFFKPSEQEWLHGCKWFRHISGRCE